MEVLNASSYTAEIMLLLMQNTKILISVNVLKHNLKTQGFEQNNVSNVKQWKKIGSHHIDRYLLHIHISQRV